MFSHSIDVVVRFADRCCRKCGCYLHVLRAILLWVLLNEGWLIYCRLWLLMSMLSRYYKCQVVMLFLLLLSSFFRWLWCCEAKCVKNAKQKILMEKVHSPFVTRASRKSCFGCGSSHLSWRAPGSASLEVGIYCGLASSLGPLHLHALLHCNLQETYIECVECLGILRIPHHILVRFPEFPSRRASHLQHVRCFKHAFNKMKCLIGSPITGGMRFNQQSGHHIFRDLSTYLTCPSFEHIWDNVHSRPGQWHKLWDSGHVEGSPHSDLQPFNIPNVLNISPIPAHAENNLWHIRVSLVSRASFKEDQWNKTPRQRYYAQSLWVV